MSRRGLYKAFYRHLGQSPGRALRRMRIDRAKFLLANSNFSLKDITELCGYRNANSLWVSFKQIVGETPGQFRSRSRAESPAFDNMPI